MRRRILNIFIVLCLMSTTIINLPVSGAKPGYNPGYTEGIYSYKIENEGAVINGMIYKSK